MAGLNHRTGGWSYLQSNMFPSSSRYSCLTLLHTSLSCYHIHLFYMSSCTHNYVTRFWLTQPTARHHLMYDSFFFSFQASNHPISSFNISPFYLLHIIGHIIWWLLRHLTLDCIKGILPHIPFGPPPSSLLRPPSRRHYQAIFDSSFLLLFPCPLSPLPSIPLSLYPSPPLPLSLSPLSSSPPLPLSLPSFILFSPLFHFLFVKIFLAKQSNTSTALPASTPPAVARTRTRVYTSLNMTLNLTILKSNTYTNPNERRTINCLLLPLPDHVGIFFIFQLFFIFLFYYHFSFFFN